jgi:hypothetical protein
VESCLKEPLEGAKKKRAHRNAFDQHLGLHSAQVRPTPGISCEAVPASILAGAGMRRRLRPSAARDARVGAAESFVSFIPLFGGAVI